jgi:hypothetical protein
MENTPSNGILHWGKRKVNDHILLQTRLGSMLEVPVTVKGRLTPDVVQKLRAAVDARSHEGAVYFLDEVTEDAPFSATHTHTAWVCAFPR